jgi:hypothetical protein
MRFLNSGTVAVAAFGFAAMSGAAIAETMAAQSGAAPVTPVGVASNTLPPPSGPGAMPLDKRIEIGGVGAVCTGIGLDAQNNPAWAAYPLKVIATGKAGMYLAKAQITLSQKNAILAEVKCAGPWVFFDVPQGDYKLSAVLEGEVASTNVRVRAPGQAQAVLRFPNQGGEVVPPALQNNDPRALPPTYDPGTRSNAAPETTAPGVGY